MTVASSGIYSVVLYCGIFSTYPLITAVRHTPRSVTQAVTRDSRVGVTLLVAVTKRRVTLVTWVAVTPARRGTRGGRPGDGRRRRGRGRRRRRGGGRSTAVRRPITDQ